MTLREFTVYFESYMLEEWDRTAAIVTEIANLAVLLNNVNSEKKVKGKTFSQCHPFRKKSKDGTPISHRNFGVLRDIAKAVVNQ